MPGSAPRFALEAGFLILLGAGTGYAGLRPVVIVAILAGGWLLVTLIELAAWRAGARPAVSYAPSPPVDEQPAPELPAAAVEEYPLRPGAADEPSEEVEAYTRILDGGSESGQHGT
jgi:hypothetical protein